MEPLPKRLKKEPLIDAVFEVRFPGEFRAGSLLPGMLFAGLDGDKKSEALPFSQIPQAMRDADANLRYAPLNRIDWGKYFVNVGDRSVSVSFKYPYPGWGSFKPAIINVMEVLKGANVIKSIERYSVKYIDLIPSTDLREQVSFVNLDVTLAGHKLEGEAFQIRLEIPKDGFIHAVQVATSATVTLHNGESREGLIVDVDTIAKQDGVTFDDFLSGFGDKLDRIHRANKEVFFDCLKPKTIEALEPEYE